MGRRSTGCPRRSPRAGAWRAFAFVAAGIGAIALAAAAASSLPEGHALGPAPRDAEGRFVNLAGEIERAGPTVTIPFFFRRIVGSFRERPGAPERVANDGAWLRENATHSEPSVTWIGHATLLVQMGHLSFLTDPIWSDTASPVSFAGPRRFVPPGLAIADLPPIDFVVISHNHYDHLDLTTLERLAARSAETRFYVPLGNGALLREAGIDDVVELDWGQSVRHGDVRVTCLPTQHWSQRGVGDERAALWGSWAVTSGDRRFYFAGDTGAFPGFAAIGEALGPFDLAAMPIGAYEPVAMMKPFHLDPEEAIAAGRAVRAEKVVAMHYGTFGLSDEPLAEPPRRFRAAGRAAGYADEAVWVLDVGETRSF
jgi:N-acyl-phosphatidylethanolamine-hydrolysing phospholipase D